MSLKRRYDEKNRFEAGVDEVGRGCIAGDVYAAAVIFPPEYDNEAINDSKELSAKRREELAEVIRENAIAVGVGIATVEEIDKMNILNAALLAMQRALEEVRKQTKIDFIIVDGNRFPGVDYAGHTTIVKGDAKFLSIAAASIIAKTERDKRMRELAQEFPFYGWEVNAGYPTKAHREGIKEHGICKWHRMSFDILGDKKMEKPRRKKRE